jgi:hypothetical protein
MLHVLHLIQEFIREDADASLGKPCVLGRI